MIAVYDPLFIDQIGLIFMLKFRITMFPLFDDVASDKKKRFSTTTKVPLVKFCGGLFLLFLVAFGCFGQPIAALCCLLLLFAAFLLLFVAFCYFWLFFGCFWLLLAAFT